MKIKVTVTVEVDAVSGTSVTDEPVGEPGSCVLTGAPGENPDDCTTHEHIPDESEEEVINVLAGILDNHFSKRKR
jgi:hypothetical protein